VERREKLGEKEGKRSVNGGRKQIGKTEREEGKRRRTGRKG
jgi:hypothetical protein